MTEPVKFADGPMAGLSISACLATPTLEGKFAGRYELADLALTFENISGVFHAQEYRYNAAFLRDDGTKHEL